MLPPLWANRQCGLMDFGVRRRDTKQGTAGPLVVDWLRACWNQAFASEPRLLLANGQDSQRPRLEKFSSSPLHRCDYGVFNVSFYLDLFLKMPKQGALLGAFSGKNSNSKIIQSIRQKKFPPAAAPSKAPQGQVHKNFTGLFWTACSPPPPAWSFACLEHVDTE